jgi:hypothetical protein
VTTFSIDLNNIDSVIEHLIVIMRRIIGEKDYNLFGNGIRAILETYIWPGLEQAGLTREQLLKRLR